MGEVEGLTATAGRPSKREGNASMATGSIAGVGVGMPESRCSKSDILLRFSKYIVQHMGRWIYVRS